MVVVVVGVVVVVVRTVIVVVLVRAVIVVWEISFMYIHTHTSYDSCVKLGRKVWKALTVDSNMAPFCNVKLHAGTDSIPDSQLTPCFHCTCSF